MKPHTVLDREARELAALHSLGALDPLESERYAAHLRACRPCSDEVASLSAPLQDLGLLAPRVDPPSELRGKLLARVRADGRMTRAGVGADEEARPASRAGDPQAADEKPAPDVQPWRSWAAVPGLEPKGDFVLTRAASAVWEPTAHAGVETRRLLVDPAQDRVTMLIRMAAGSSYPPHRHGGPEECYVIEGDLRTGDTVMHAGDYKFSDANSLDATQSTRDGCLLLIVSSMRDEILPQSRL